VERSVKGAVVRKRKTITQQLPIRLLRSVVPRALAIFVLPNAATSHSVAKKCSTSCIGDFCIAQRLHIVVIHFDLFEQRFLHQVLVVRTVFTMCID